MSDLALFSLSEPMFERRAKREIQKNERMSVSDPGEKIELGADSTPTSMPTVFQAG
jgi:hypothetical protein